MSNLSVGIVGLPNVGKSTLFNVLLSRKVADAANYPFCTIEPNVGVIEVPDPRLATIAKVAKTETIVPAAIEFVDIAGLVEGAHKGHGLGNKFLAHIREVDVITMVLRDFADPDVARAGSNSPTSDYQTLLTELQLADLQILEKQQEPKGNVSKEELQRYAVVNKVKALLEQGQPAHAANLDEKERWLIKSFALLTLKPIIIVVNTDPDQLTAAHSPIHQYQTIYLSAKLEEEMVDLTPAEKREFLQAYGIQNSGMEQLIKAAYTKLGLITFITAGEKEVRAWPIPQGTKAPAAAGVIHSDFEKNFIRAKVTSVEDYIHFAGWLGVKEAGKLRFEGKQYAVNEGDIVEFLIN